MGITLEQIHNTIRELGLLMPERPNRNSTREYSLKEAVILMGPRLMEMREMGFTTKEMVKGLEDKGISVKGPTLNRYLCEYQSTLEAGDDSKEAKAKKKRESPKVKDGSAKIGSNACEEGAAHKHPASRGESLTAPKPVAVAGRDEFTEKPKPLFGQSGKSGQSDSGAI